jgi:hypothetical protein
MSANQNVLRASDLIGSPVEAMAPQEVETPREPRSWDAEVFAREQIRCLVRRVFLGVEAQTVKQVVFSPAGPSSDVASICDQVGRALALETSADVAILVRDQDLKQLARFPRHVHTRTIKSSSTRIGINAWRVPEFDSPERPLESGLGRYWLARLAELRSEFEYVVIHGPVVGTSSEAASLAELADGIVLVLGAGTRRAAVRRIKETLEAGRSRILGTVLSERAFPIPERIYRRL